MKNEYLVLGDEVIIRLNRKKGPPLGACVSVEDFDKVDSFPGTWCATWEPDIQNYYCAGNLPLDAGKRKTVRLHRWIMDAPDGMEVDHRDAEDTLNNRRDNLRIVTRSENMQNRVGAQRNSKSGIRGVSWVEKSNKWRATIKLNGKFKHLGCFEDIVAAEAVVIAARVRYMPYSKDAQELKEG
jgi:hypothetical protein